MNPEEQTVAEISITSSGLSSLVEDAEERGIDEDAVQHLKEAASHAERAAKITRDNYVFGDGDEEE